MRHDVLPLFQYVFDSSSLIFIERARLLGRLRKRHTEIILPEKVAEEVRQPGSPLKNFLKRYASVVVSFSGPEEEKYLEIRAQPGIDDGEAAAMAIALVRRVTLVIEDKKGRQKAQNHGVQSMGWREFIQGA